MEKTIKRGDIYYAELNPVIGSEPVYYKHLTRPTKD